MRASKLILLWNVLPVYSVYAIDAIIYIYFFFHFQIRLYSKGHSNGHLIHIAYTSLCMTFVCWLFMAFWMPITTHLFSSFSIRFQLMPDCGVYRFIRMYVWHHVVIDIVFTWIFIEWIWIKSSDFIIYFVSHRCYRCPMLWHSILNLTFLTFHIALNPNSNVL